MGVIEKAIEFESRKQHELPALRYASVGFRCRLVKERRVFSPIQMPACFHGDLTIRIASHALHHANNTVPRTINIMKCGAGLSDFR